jgi:general secretion pathway protein G
LVEIMIVIVIMGLLAGVVTVNVRGYLNRAKQNTARMEISTITKALETFQSKANRYPTNDEGLAVLYKASEEFPEPLLDGKAVDPWKHPYQYNCPGVSKPFDVICLGADGREGGTGVDADIRSDDLKE